MSVLLTYPQCRVVAADEMLDLHAEAIADGFINPMCKTEDAISAARDLAALGRIAFAGDLADLARRAFAQFPQSVAA